MIARIVVGNLQKNVLPWLIFKIQNWLQLRSYMREFKEKHPEMSDEQLEIEETAARSERKRHTSALNLGAAEYAYNMNGALYIKARFEFAQPFYLSHDPSPLCLFTDYGQIKNGSSLGHCSSFFKFSIPFCLHCSEWHLSRL